MKLTNRKVYKTIINHVEYKGIEYLIQFQEDELEDTSGSRLYKWEIYYKHEQWVDPIELDTDSDLGQKLMTFCISFCQNQ